MDEHKSIFCSECGKEYPVIEKGQEFTSIQPPARHQSFFAMCPEHGRLMEQRAVPLSQGSDT
ncbi:MAG: hypothetical protein ACYCSH_03050 [Acidithiobacillus sp.]